MIGDDVVVTILDIRGDQVRIGVSAPRHVDVHREEVYRDLQEANRSAASPTSESVHALGALVRATPGAAAGPSVPPAGSPETRL